jgi:hypothetical protein
MADRHAYPVVSLEDFVEGNADDGSIGCNLQGSDRLKIPDWFKALKDIRDRPRIQDVLMEINQVDDGDAWPFSDCIYIITSASEEQVESWVKALHPDEVAEGYIEVVPSGAPLLQEQPSLPLAAPVKHAPRAVSGGSSGKRPVKRMRTRDDQCVGLAESVEQRSHCRHRCKGPKDAATNA